MALSSRQKEKGKRQKDRLLFVPSRRKKEEDADFASFPFSFFLHPSSFT